MNSVTASPLRTWLNRIPLGTAVLMVLLPFLAVALVYTGGVYTEYLKWSAGGAGLLFLAGRPPRVLIALSVMAGLAIWPVLGPLTLPSALAAWGLAGMALAGLRLPWADARARGAALGAGIFPLTLVLWSTFRYTIGLRQPTLDALLFAWDAELGMPAYAVGRVVHAHSRLYRVLGRIYLALPFLTTIPYALVDGSRERMRLLGRYYVASCVGLVLYTVVPGCGPIYVENAFPQLPSLPIPLPLSLPSDYERNAIPSLHLTGVLLAWWAMPRWRWLGVLWTLGTAVATLGLGEHYAVDLLVALPFAAVWQAASERRWGLAAVSTALTALWIVGLRGPPPPAPVVLLLTVISVVPVWILLRTGAAPARAQDSAGPPPIAEAANGRSA